VRFATKYDGDMMKGAYIWIHNTSIGVRDRETKEVLVMGPMTNLLWSCGRVAVTVATLGATAEINYCERMEGQRWANMNEFHHEREQRIGKAISELRRSKSEGVKDMLDTIRDI